jgi:hypothetical protein
MFVVNNMRANVAALLYDDHDIAMKLLHSEEHTMWDGKVKDRYGEPERGGGVNASQ